MTRESTIIRERFAKFVDALTAFEANGDLDNSECPLKAAWNAAMEAMDAAPLPKTPSDAALLLRFGLATNGDYGGKHKHLMPLLLTASPTERAAYIEEHWRDFASDDRHAWGALACLERQQPSSLIYSLNARYEQAWAEYNRLDDAKAQLPETATGPASTPRFNIESGMAANQREVDALRLAILYQVPVTWPEALILAVHVRTVSEVADNDDERRALETGLDTLLDFMFGEIDHEAISGQQLLNIADIAYHSRRRRTGQLEAL